MSGNILPTSVARRQGDGAGVEADVVRVVGVAEPVARPPYLERVGLQSLEQISVGLNPPLSASPLNPQCAGVAVPPVRPNMLTKLTVIRRVFPVRCVCELDRAAIIRSVEPLGLGNRFRLDGELDFPELSVEKAHVRVLRRPAVRPLHPMRIDRGAD